MLREVKDGPRSEDEASKRLERARHWGWTAIDPASQRVLAIEIGPRTLAMAQRVVHRVVQTLAASWVPLWLTDGNRDYTRAFLAHFGFWHQPERKRAQGPAPQPRWLPWPELLEAQGVKSSRRRRLGDVKHRVVCGTLAAIEQVLAACGWQSNTALVERLNLDIRQRVAAVGRRVNTRCQGADGMQHQLALFHTYDNFVLPHSSVRQALPESEPTNGTGSAKQWRPGTPARAAGLTDHVWTLRAVVLSRVPPWPQPQMV
jgi:IS1 family transposase